MKLKYKFLIVWFLFLAILLVFSCGPKKTVVETKNTTTNTTNSSNDTTTTKVTKRPELELQVDKPIPDIKTGVSKNCDSICNQEKEKIFESLNGKLKQGKNEISFYYNKYTKTLTAYSKLQEAYDSIVISKSKKDVSTKTTIETIKPVLIEKPLTQEQKFNLWVGRLFWLFLLIFIIWKIKK
ncbi:hypothetical protein [Flavobacterium capsici]|uniref:Lipoprotein n=1 Tax=Flavobacterium capsici TaxID=3075618 RepID=A0AA96EYP1_9FLAO|nr:MULTISPECIES: hypothetical protein [unclassified Flavobacterium]WNM19285.1 hypothetical protein RN608_01050 [Flavobacterium sp. PMR2A8]WNM20674.1 hypothetical protein RN605_08220 [Flavobacterium sp. PMTSA4]